MSIRVKDLGIELGSTIPDIKLENWDNSFFEINSLSGNKALIFTSLSCSHCIDLLPYLSQIQERHMNDLILFSAGTNEENAEMVEYFGWNFPVVCFDTKEMEKNFNVTVLPFTMIADGVGTVLQKGVIYNSDDFHFLNKNT